MKSLNKVQKISQVLHILSQIAFVFTIVGFALCLFAVVGVSVLGDDPEFVKIFTDEGIVYNFKEVLCLCIVASIECLAGIVVYFYVKNFYKKELQIGTPFNKEVAQDAKRLGLIRIFVPLGAMIVNAIIIACFRLNIEMYEITGIAMGLVYLVLGCVFDYGADVINVKVQQANLPKETTVEIEEK